MGEFREAFWEPELGSSLSRRARRAGVYRQYIPDRITLRPVVVSPELAARAATVERAIRDLGSGRRAVGLQGIARFLLRSEAIASSMIEGIAPSPQQVALAELAQTESVRGFSRNAELVANNITVVRRATTDLVDADAVVVHDIEALHDALLPHERHKGLRQVQNWIGGSNWSPLEAEFVPPPPDEVPDLMADLVTYLNGSTHGALIQAGLVHAQFETIHPFTDGNGRVGRALIHTALMRRGLMPEAVLPVSLVLSTLSDRYLNGLSAFRNVGDSSAAESVAGMAIWLETFIDASETAAEQARVIAVEVAELHEDFTTQLATYRESQGLRAQPRSTSATARILEALPEVPVLTTRSVEKLVGVSFPAARGALEELAEAGILSRKSVDRGTTAYLARDVFDLIAAAEQRMR